VNVLVLGAAVSGRAAARLARRLGHEVAVFDERSRAVADLSSEEYRVHSGTWNPGLLTDVDLVVTSPGFAEGSTPIRDVRDREITLWSELEFGCRHLDAPYVAVTGTNGKTTVTTAAAAMLEASGRRTVAAGNVGTAVSAIAGEPWDVVVVEASSFQLRFVSAFHPSAAAVVNVAPDHLDWHGTLSRYTAAKARIFERMTDAEPLAFDVEDRGAASLVAAAAARLVPVAGDRVPEGGNGVEDGLLVVDGHRLRAGIADPSFRLDLVLAATVARAAGASLEAIATVAATFRPGAHRREIVGTWDGVRWVDDSKATNPHAARAAVAAFRPVVLLAGGRNKGLDLTGLATAPGVRHLVAFGEAGPALAAAAGPREVTRVATLREAVDVAAAVARSGDTVLLAPGCTSFDEFASYAERGRTFARLVRERGQGSW